MTDKPNVLRIQFPKSKPQENTHLTAKDFRDADAMAFLPASRLEPKPLHWLWYPRISRGTITILAAPGGVGKGLMLADLAAGVTRGWEFPLELDGGEKFERGRVLWCETEDMLEEVLTPRWMAAHVDLQRITHKTPDQFNDLVSGDHLRRFITTHDVKLIVLSPLNSYLGTELTNGNDAVIVRKALERLNEAIEGTACSVIGICHINKKDDASAIMRVIGSNEYVNVVRNVLMLRTEGPIEDNMVRVVHAKHNNGPKGNDLIYEKYNTRKANEPRGQYWAITWEPTEGNVNPDKLYDRSAGDKLTALEALKQALANRQWRMRNEVLDEIFAEHKIKESAVEKAFTRSKELFASRCPDMDRKLTQWRLK
jgi:RecA-family ATPase